MKKNKGDIVIVLVVLAVVLFMVGLIAISFIRISWNTGEGKQIGYVSATEIEGLIFKTKRAYIKPTLESTQEDVYCVIDESVYQELKESSSSNTKIEIEHISWFSPSVFDCKGESAIIIKVIR